MTDRKSNATIGAIISRVTMRPRKYVHLQIFNDSEFKVKLKG